MAAPYSSPTAAFRAWTFNQNLFLSPKSVCDLWIFMWMMAQLMSQVLLPPLRLKIRQIFINHINKIHSIRY